jgi:MFS family permease
MTTYASLDKDSGVGLTPRVLRIFGAHALTSVASNLLMLSFFFYAKQVFHWSAASCLGLVSGEGLVYILGALSANKIAATFGRRGGLLLLQTVLVILCAIAWIYPTPAAVVPVLLVYTLCCAAVWPAVESLVVAGTEGDVLSRRLGLYNFSWSAVGAITLAVSGSIISRFPSGIYLIPLVAHACAGVLLLIGGLEPPSSTAASHPIISAEPELLAQRTLALHLSRIALPSTYVVVYSLAALMPSLRVIQSFGESSQTVVASVWMASRFVTFVFLGATTGWHSRPRLLLVAAIVMLVAFLGMTIRPAEVFGGSLNITRTDQVLMILSQIPLGAAMGLIYSASLYFGMVLSDGSTEHGGYHEALIGLGQSLGPAAALASQTLRPGDNAASVYAVAGLVGLTILAAAALSFCHRAGRAGSPVASGHADRC